MYECTSKKGLVNQGWKDSGDAIVNADGTLATPPIALVEVQGYVYLAKRLLADVYRRAGEGERAETLQRGADELRQRFNRDFWLEDHGFYALALHKDRKPAAVVSSNPGQALWSGIVDRERAGRVVKRLMEEDMFSGWGVRTLSAKEKRYNPIGYHLGTVWPHDNAIIGAGCRHYGFADATERIFEDILHAAMSFEHYRLPEVFAGFSRQEYDVPVHYPVACHPQAWAAASVLYLLETMLGLHPDGFSGRLRISDPRLPGFVNWVELRGLRVGQARASLRFARSGDGVKICTLDVQGELKVDVESAPQ